VYRKNVQEKCETKEKEPEIVEGSIKRQVRNQVMKKLSREILNLKLPFFQIVP
jgi:hypothetical protein